MRAAGDDAHGRRLRSLIVILWRAGVRIQEPLSLAEADLGHRRGALPVRRGQGETNRPCRLSREAALPAFRLWRQPGGLARAVGVGKGLDADDPPIADGQ